MGAYRPDRKDTVQLVKEAADIVEIIGEHVSLKRAGANLKGLCPFHAEKTPSFIVSPERHTFHCFGCAEGGDVFTFMMQYHRMTFPEALKELARRYNITLPEERLSTRDLGRAKEREALHAANEKAAGIFHRFLLNDPAAEPARRYLAERGVTSEIIERFQLGFAPDRWDFLVNTLGREKISSADAVKAGLIVPKERGGHYDRFRGRVLFPIFALTGKIVGFGGRILGDGQPKYMNSPESAVFDKSRTLFGIYQNRETIRKEKRCLIVEGNFDLLSLVVHGIANVVAPLGTALTLAHVRSLRGYADEAILLFDGDTAGLKAAMRSVPLFLSEQLAARIAILPDNHDPDTFVREYGKEGLEALLDKAKSLPEFVFDALVEQHGLTVEGKSRIISELRPLIKAMGDRNLERTIFAGHFGEKLGLPPEKLLEGIGPPPKHNTTDQAPLDPVKLSKKEETLLEFLLVHIEYCPAFFDAGLEEIITTAPGRILVDALKTLLHDETPARPEQLLDLVDRRVRPLLSRMLTAAPSYADETKTETASEMLTWIKQNSLKAKKERLIEQINQAHGAKNEALCLELMERKKQMDKALNL